MYDVIVIGGSYAGMAAALHLARGRRKVLVIDAGRRRNRFASSSHGFLTRDGEAPDALAAEARSQLLAYPNVHWVDAPATGASGEVDAFSVMVEDGRRFDGRRLVIATGVIDILPDIPGLTERWGTTVFHCPYCHGYELDEGRIGVLASGLTSLHQAMMIPDWGRTTFFVNRSCSLDHGDRERLRERGVVLETVPVASIGGTGNELLIQLDDGRQLALDGLFVAPWIQQASPIAAELGCKMEEGPLGAVIETDVAQSTSVDGVYGCGDAARSAGSIPFAVADGSLAGMAAHQSLMFGKV